jgi:mitochondrial fission protein ELM1
VVHQKIIHRVHKRLYDRNVLVDIIEPGRDLSAYDLVILPSTVVIDTAFAERVSQRVAEGACVLAIGQIGMRDDNDNYLSHAGPDHLQELLGVRIAGGMYLTSHVGPDEALWVPANSARATALGVSGSIGNASLAGTAPHLGGRSRPGRGNAPDDLR